MLYSAKLPLLSGWHAICFLRQLRQEVSAVLHRTACTLDTCACVPRALHSIDM